MGWFNEEDEDIWNPHSSGPQALYGSFIFAAVLLGIAVMTWLSSVGWLR